MLVTRETLMCILNSISFLVVCVPFGCILVVVLQMITGEFRSQQISRTGESSSFSLPVLFSLWSFLRCLYLIAKLYNANKTIYFVRSAVYQTLPLEEKKDLLPLMCSNIVTASVHHVGVQPCRATSCLLCFSNTKLLMRSSICMCVHVHAVYSVEMDLMLPWSLVRMGFEFCGSDPSVISVFQIHLNWISALGSSDGTRKVLIFTLYVSLLFIRMYSLVFLFLSDVKLIVKANYIYWLKVLV